MTIHARLDEVLRLLRQRADWTADELATNLEVSRRTILRDLARLRDRGFIISGLAGPGGGVHLEPTSVMITSQLTGDEVVALILSIAIARATPGVPFAAGADQALAKIEASLPRGRSADVQQFMQRVLVGGPSTEPTGTLGTVDTHLVSAFERALTTSHELAFAYTDKNGNRTRRHVEPHGLLVRAPCWYVIAWDPTRDGRRLFRADRIARPRVTDRAFIPRPHEIVRGAYPVVRTKDSAE